MENSTCHLAMDTTSTRDETSIYREGTNTISAHYESMSTTSTAMWFGAGKSKPWG
jgi:hypothetical protein